MKKILLILLIPFLALSQISTPNWSTQGITANSSHWLGTRNNIPLIFKVNNSEIGRFTSNGLSNFNFEYLTSSQINAIIAPKLGRKVYNITTNKEMYWNGTHWESGSGGSVESVNGILPDINGNISISLTNVTTGTFLNRPTTANNGDVYVVSGDTNTTINGVTYISNGITWYEITPHQGLLDARYLQIANAFSGNYNDLINKPTIPTVPTNISSFTNDVGYLTSNAVTSVNTKTGAVILTKNDISLGNVDNTSDINKPISTATQNALNNKENTITTGTTSQYWRGDKTWVDFPTIPTVPTVISAFTNDAGYINLSSLSATTPLTYNNTTGVFAMPQATTSTSGFISSTDFDTFNNKGTPFALSGSNVDANSNKTSLIHRDGSVQINNGFLRANNGTSPFYSTTLEPDTQGSKINFGTNLAPSNLMIIGAYNSQNNIDNKTRDFQIFGTGTTGIMVKATTGRVGVGTVSPTGNLEVQNGTSSTNLIIGNPAIGKTSASLSTSADTNGSFIIQATRTAGTSWGDVVINNSGGNVGVGKTAPSEKLDVAGNIRLSGALMPNNSAGTAGQVLVSSGTGQAPVWQTIGSATPYTAGDGIAISGSNVVSINAWVYFVQTWSIEPTKIATITSTPTGDVWSYTLKGVTRYRFVPTVYDPTQDAFYSSWNAGTSTLSGLIITRG